MTVVLMSRWNNTKSNNYVRTTCHPGYFVPPRLTRVGVCDLVGLVRIQPDLLLAAAQYAGGQPLLEPEHAGEHRGVPLTHWTNTQTYTTQIHVYVCAYRPMS